MWLLLAVVVIAIVIGSVLYKRTFTTEELALTGVMAALSLVAYLFFRVPFYGGSSFHLGNTFTALTALLLDGVSGGLAGAIGLALADILAGDPGYAVTTFVLKFIIGITCGAVAHKAFKLRDLDKHSSGYLVKVIVSAGSGLLLNVLTDPFLGYFRNVYIFGQEYTVAQALTKTKFTVQKISIIGIMAAMSFVAYEFFRIPNVFGTGSSFHLGNTFTALTAMLLDGVSGGLAGAIGLALADVVAGDPGYAITTFILKFIIGLVCGAVSHKVIHLRTFPTGNKLKYVAAVTASAFSGLLVNVFTDPFIGYFRNLYIFGQPAEFVSVVTKIASGVTLVNSLLSTVCAVVLYIALRPALEKAHLLPKE